MRCSTSKPSRAIRSGCARRTAANATFDKVLTVTISDVNENQPPTDISLSNASIAENQAVATTVGTLSATDPDAGDTHTFTLVGGTGSTDNASFQITGNELKTNAVFNFEAKSSYSIRVRATDQGNLSTEKVFTITITDANDAPVTTNDSYSGAIGNTRFVLGTTSTGPRVVGTGNNPNANDTDPEGSAVSCVPETVATTGGGSATINSDCSFTYNPGPGDKNQNDTFTYKATDGSLQSNGTVTIAITNALVWYVDRDAASNGDGRSHSPLQNLAGINGAGGSGDSDTTGEVVFLYDSATSYTGGIPLEANQKLIGEPEGLIVNATTLVPAAGSNPTITNSGGTGIGLASGVLVRHVNVSGTSGAGVTGNGATGVDYGLSTISNPGGDGFSLTNTDQVAIRSTTISGSNGAGVDGTGVTGFSYVNGSIVNAGDTNSSALDGAFAFNSGAANNLDGAVVITGNTVTNPYGGGIDIFNTAGTISSADISGNTLTSSANPSLSKEDGISLSLRGTTTTVASLTQATLQNNAIQNFPSGRGLVIDTGNGASVTAPAGTYGTPGSATNRVVVTGNSIKGDPTAKFSGPILVAAIEGRGSGNFAITNNGTAANPLTNSVGAGIGFGVAGDTDADVTITGNFIAPNNEFNSPGISLSTDKHIEPSGTLSDPDVNATVSNNTTSGHEGAGIRVLQANSNGSLNLKLQNNTFGAPIQSFAGIRVENGSSADAAFNPTMCANISGNTAGSGSADAFGDKPPGINLIKRSTSSTTYVFGLVGLSPSPATAAQTETYVTTQNPSSALGAGFWAGKRVGVISGDQFTSCTLPF